MHKKTSAGVDTNPYTQPEICRRQEDQRGDLQGRAGPQRTSRRAVKYDTTPPIGGNHSPYWADCSGTVYSAAIANENAVHMLEHGAVWITYGPALPARSSPRSPDRRPASTAWR